MENKDQKEFERLRYVELKHGRIAMIAVVGNLVTLSGARFPGMLSHDMAYADVPAGLAAFPAMPPLGVLQIALFIFFAEVGMSEIMDGGEFLGDFRHGGIIPDFGWDKQTAEWKEKKRMIELNNGRAAMMGITGLVSMISCLHCSCYDADLSIGLTIYNPFSAVTDYPRIVG